MANDRSIGGLILVGSIVGILIYLYLIIFYSLLVLMITAFVGVALILGIMAWIGYTMATAPPPSPLEDGAIPGAMPDATPESVEQPASNGKTEEKNVGGKE